MLHLDEIVNIVFGEVRDLDGVLSSLLPERSLICADHGQASELISP